MQIVDFSAGHVGQAVTLATLNYQEERSHIPILPAASVIPALDSFAANGLSVAAMEGDILLGFMCSVPLFDRPFQIDGLVGAYVPLHAHGAVAENREKIYASMYQRAAEKWLYAGAKSHAITLYAHDSKALEQFFNYRFGMHGIDAVCGLGGLKASSIEGYQLTELEPNDFGQLWPLHCRMQRHFTKSPIFIDFPMPSAEEFAMQNQRKGLRYFTAMHHGEAVGFIKLLGEGETFVSKTRCMMNIRGAFLLPEHRGRGVYDALLARAASVLAGEGYRLLGVDFESFNPTARGFWLKHFTPYTASVVRRIG